MDVTEFLESVSSRKDSIISRVKERFIEELVSPLQATIVDIIENKGKREQELSTYQQKLEELKTAKTSIDEQIQMMNMNFRQG